MNPLMAMQAAKEGMKMYDKLADWTSSHGWSIDDAISKIIEKLPDGLYDVISGRPIDGRENLKEVVSAFLKRTPADDGDFEEVFEDDVNGDGDTDVTAVDTTGDGNIDTVVTSTDSKKEEKDSDEVAKDIVGEDEKTSTGKDRDDLDNMNGGDHDDEKSFAENNSSGDSDLKSSWKDMVEALMGGRVY